MPWCRRVPRDIAFIKEGNVYAQTIHTAEECLDLANRHRSEDLSVSLSQAGRTLEWATIGNAENLLQAGGETTLACSSRHRDGVSDGRYDPCITLDFGRVLTGYAELEVDAPAGAHIEIGYAERLVDEHFNNAIECPFADRAIMVEGKNFYRPMIWRSFRYLRLRIKHCEAGLRVKAVRAVEVNYPYEKRGVFRGNKRMEKIFDICRTTLELCSIESLMDTPFREQAQWLGDVAAIVFDCVDGDTARKIIETVFDTCSIKTTETQPFFMVVVLEALRRNGRTDLALRLIEDRWGKRMVDRGLDSCTEEWYQNGS